MDQQNIVTTMIDVAPHATSFAEVGRMTDAALGLGWTDAQWRGFWKSKVDLRASLKSRLRRAEIVRTDEPEDQFDIDRYIRLQIEASREWEKKERLATVVQARIETASPVAICFSSDWHIGPSGTTYEALHRDNLRMAAHNRIYTVLGGDYGDNFILDALRHAGADAIFRAGEQQKTVFEHEVRTLASTGSLLAIGIGNHDRWLSRVSGLDPANVWLGPLRKYAIEEGGTIELTVGGITYTIWRRHRPRRRSSVHPLHSVVWEYSNGDTDFDIGVIEHDHVPRVGLFDGHRRPDGSTDRIAVRTGSYKLRDPYAVENGYLFGGSAVAGVVLWPDRRRMLPVLGLDNIEDILDGSI